MIWALGVLDCRETLVQEPRVARGYLGASKASGVRAVKEWCRPARALLGVVAVVNEPWRLTGPLAGEPSKPEPAVATSPLLEDPRLSVTCNICQEYNTMQKHCKGEGSSLQDSFLNRVSHLSPRRS